MTPLFKKLNLKDQREMLVLNAPAGFERELDALEDVHVLRDPDQAKNVPFLLAFATLQSEVDLAADCAAHKTEGDALVWVAYPKMSSKRYRCEFNRDTGFAALGRAGFEPVRQVAIDEDWSAVRFRRVAFIKTLTRSQGMMLSDEGRQRKFGE